MPKISNSCRICEYIIGREENIFYTDKIILLCKLYETREVLIGYLLLYNI